MSITGDTLTSGFASELRARTSDVHRRAETSAFMRALFGGRLDRSGYATYVSQLHAVYGELDATAERMATDPVAGPFADPRLDRREALVRDLAYLLGSSEAQPPPLLPATLEYRDRLRRVARHWPGGFVAHHYTRYLGDLSGGRRIAEAVRRHITGGAPGTAFYDLPVEDPDGYKAAYRARLDAAPWDAGERERIVDEVLVAYRMNQALLAEVADACGLAP